MSLDLPKCYKKYLIEGLRSGRVWIMPWCAQLCSRFVRVDHLVCSGQLLLIISLLPWGSMPQLLISLPSSPLLPQFCPSCRLLPSYCPLAAAFTLLDPVSPSTSFTVLCYSHQVERTVKVSSLAPSGLPPERSSALTPPVTLVPHSAAAGLPPGRSSAGPGHGGHG